MTDIKEQLAELSRGSDEILPEGGLEEKLKLGRPLNVYVGFDFVYVGFFTLLQVLKSFCFGKY